MEGRQQELREAQNRLAEARVAALKQEAEVQQNIFLNISKYFSFQERAAARRLEAAARELEAQKRQKAMDISGNKLDLSGEARKNKVTFSQTWSYGILEKSNGCLQLTEGRFVGSIYVGGEEERSEGQRDKSNSWRVKL